MIRRFSCEEKGATAVITAFVLTVLLGFATLVVDAGVLLQERRYLQNAVDGAALAAAQQIATGATQPQEQAYLYAEKNGVSRSDLVVNSVVTIFNQGDAVRVRARRKVDLFFAPVLGVNFEYAEAEATAIVTNLKPKGVWPWGVTQESLGPGLVKLKLGARNSMVGNFMALDFPSSSGAYDYREYVMYGFDAMSEPGPSGTWQASTQTGNVAGPTIQGISYLFGQSPTVPTSDLRHPRVGLVPILKAWTWDEVRGRSYVEIVDFAAFYLEDVVQAPTGLVELSGTFMQNVYGVGRSTDIGAPLDGLIGTRLWE